MGTNGIALLAFNELSRDQQVHVLERFLEAHPPDWYLYAVTPGGCVMFRERLEIDPEKRSNAMLPEAWHEPAHGGAN